MTKTLPETYREAAELILNIGKVTGQMKETREGFCRGYCTMGAVFEAGGLLTDSGTFIDTVLEGVDNYVESDDFVRLAKPVADQIVSSGRRVLRVEMLDDESASEGSSIFWTIARWNDHEIDGSKPSAEDVATLLRETANAVELDGSKK